MGVRLALCMALCAAIALTSAACFAVSSIHGNIGSETYVYLNAVGDDQGNGSARTASVTGDYSIGGLPGDRYYVISDGVRKFYLPEGADLEINEAPGFPPAYEVPYGPSTIKSRRLGQTFISNAEYLQSVSTVNVADPVQIHCQVYEDGPGGSHIWDGGYASSGSAFWWAVWVVNPPGSVKLVPGKRYYVEFTSEQDMMIPCHETDPYRDGMAYVLHGLSGEMLPLASVDLTGNVNCLRPGSSSEYYSHGASKASWVNSVYQSYTAKGKYLRKVHFFLPWDASQTYTREDFIFTLHVYGGRTSPLGAQIGPAKRASAGTDYSDGCGAVWDAGECPTTPGQQYLIRVTKAGGFVAWYKENDTSGNGDFFRDGVFMPNTTLQGTISADAEDLLPLNISSVQVTSLGATGVRITWNTDFASTSQVEWWTGSSDHQHTLLDETATTSHSVDVTRLMGSTTYYYRVKSYCEGHVYATTDGTDTFSTGCPGTLAGIVTDDTLQPVVGASITTSSGPFGAYSTVTDASGSYIIEHMEPSTYDVVASRDGLVTTTVEDVLIPGCQLKNLNITMPAIGEYIANGGFEAGLSSTPPDIIGWPLLTWTMDPPEVHCGSFFAEITPRSGTCFLTKAGNYTYGAGYSGQSVKVEAGKTYRLTAYYRIYWVGGDQNAVRMQVALDPTGYAGSDGYNKSWLVRSPVVLWMTPEVASPWLPVSVEATAQTDHITAWLMYWHAPNSSIWRISCWDDVTISRVVGSLPSAADLPDGTRVAVKGLVVTAAQAQLGDMVYVEASDRSRGIQLYIGAFSSDAAVGDVVTVEGKLATRDGERALEECVITKTATTTPLKPLGLTPGRFGTLNPGLLMTTWGRVVQSNETFFAVDDGTGQALPVMVPSTVTAPAVDSFVRVTGVCGTTLAGGSPRHVLRLRESGDLEVIQ